MSEPLDEISVLRQTVTELTNKATNRKTRIAALEDENKKLKASLATAEHAAYEATVGEPLQRLADAISPMPDLFLAEFAKLGYKIAKRDGKLVVMQNDKPVEGTEFTMDGLVKLLAKSDDPAHKNFKHLIITSRASGGGAVGQQPSSFIPVEEKLKPSNAPKTNFGLR